MALPTARPRLSSLIILLCSTSVTSMFLKFNLQAPKNFWEDPSCMRKDFTPVTAQESLNLATRGAKRLLNLNDDYQAWVFKLLFKQDRDFSILDNDETQAWDVVEIGSWIGAMKFEVNRDDADVRIYCDNDARWTRVPNDPISIRHGMTPNSQRTDGVDAEYEDTVNFMRRDTGNLGCQEPGTLGVSYDTVIPPADNPRAPSRYRQTITLCDLAFTSSIKKFADIPLREWRSMEMDPLRLIPTNVLLYQLFNLEPYWIARVLRRTDDEVDNWASMLGKARELLVDKPAPFAWNAILAYAADLGWGLQRDLTPAQYSTGRDLFRYTTALKNVPLRRGGPVTLPDWMTLPTTVWGTE